jgi:hypothetical protein
MQESPSAGFSAVEISVVRFTTPIRGNVIRN